MASKKSVKVSFFTSGTQKMTKKKLENFLFLPITNTSIDHIKKRCIQSFENHSYVFSKWVLVLFFL